NYIKREAFCLETQHFPDSPNQHNFTSVDLKLGETYTQTCIYKFSVESSLRYNKSYDKQHKEKHASCILDIDCNQALSPKAKPQLMLILFCRPRFVVQC